MKIFKSEEEMDDRDDDDGHEMREREMEREEEKDMELIIIEVCCCDRFIKNKSADGRLTQKVLFSFYRSNFFSFFSFLEPTTQ